MSWVRNYRTDRKWDNKLWELASNLQNFKAIGMHHAIIGDSLVWIQNYPYASGLICEDGFGHGRKSCSRATALYLHDQLKKARILLILKGIEPEESESLIFSFKLEDTKKVD